MVKGGEEREPRGSSGGGGGGEERGFGREREKKTVEEEWATPILYHMPKRQGSNHQESRHLSFALLSHFKFINSYNKICLSL